MLEGERDLIGILEASVRQRVLHAQSIELLSNRNDKLVEVVGDIGGARFIRRSYGQPEVARIEQVGLTFGEAWKKMHEIFGGVGIGMVSSIVFYPFSSESQFPVVVASEYVEGVDIISAGVEIKTALATSLGNILLQPGKYRPSFESFAHDMFKVRKDKAGIERLVLIDPDPYLVDGEALLISEDAQDVWYAAYIKYVSNSLCNWSHSSERYLVLSAFINSLRPLALDLNSSERQRTLDALMETHSRAQGFDFSF